MKKLASFILILSPILAADANFHDSDFIKRAINFVIFLALLAIFFYKPFRNALKERSSSIAKKLSETNNKLKATKSNREIALKEREIAKQNAEEIINTANKEIYMATKKIEEKSKQVISNMIKNHENLMSIERNRMEKEALNEVLDEIFKDLKIKPDEYLKLLQKAQRIANV